MTEKISVLKKKMKSMTDDLWKYFNSLQLKCGLSRWLRKKWRCGPNIKTCAWLKIHIVCSKFKWYNVHHNTLKYLQFYFSRRKMRSQSTSNQLSNHVNVNLKALPEFFIDNIASLHDTTRSFDFFLWFAIARNDVIIAIIEIMYCKRFEVFKLWNKSLSYEMFNKNTCKKHVDVRKYRRIEQ